MMLALRDKVAIFAGSFLIFLFLFFQFAISPLTKESRKLTTRTIPQRVEHLKKVRELGEEVLSLKGEVGVVERAVEERDKDKSFPMRSFLEGLANKLEIREKLSSIKLLRTIPCGTYEEVRWEVKLRGITMDQLVKYLYGIESPENLLLVKSLKRVKPVRRKGEDRPLEATFEVAILRQASGR